VTAPLQDPIGSHVVTQQEITLRSVLSNWCSEKSVGSSFSKQVSCPPVQHICETDSVFTNSVATFCFKTLGYQFKEAARLEHVFCKEYKTPYILNLSERQGCRIILQRKTTWGDLGVVGGHNYNWVSISVL
jgi:hypothetical protein